MKRFKVKYVTYYDEDGDEYRGYHVIEHYSNHTWATFDVDFEKRDYGYNKKEAYRLARKECKRLNGLYEK